jgi:hypothetical protein
LVKLLAAIEIVAIFEIDFEKGDVKKHFLSD